MTKATKKGKLKLKTANKQVRSARRTLKKIAAQIADTDGRGYKGVGPGFNIEKAEADIRKTKSLKKLALSSEKKAKADVKRVVKKAAAHAKKEKEAEKKDQLKNEELMEKDKAKAAAKILKLRMKERALQAAEIKAQD